MDENLRDKIQKTLEVLVYEKLPELKKGLKGRDSLVQCDFLIERLRSEIGRLYIIRTNK